jgi:peptidyl-dipeptidase A
LTRTAEVRAFVDSLEERLAPLERRIEEAWWALATTGTDEAQRELVSARNEYNRLFSDETERRRVAEWYEVRAGLGDPLLVREVEVLHRMYEAARGEEEMLERVEELEAQANAVFSNHRAELDGRSLGENEVREILRASDDEDLRRRVWQASKTVGEEAEPLVRELARLRNTLARDAGFPDHYHRSLWLQEIEPGELESLMGELERLTEEPFRDIKVGLDAHLKERFSTEQVHPWHLPDPFFQEAPERGDLDVDGYFSDKSIEGLTRETYDRMGFDVRPVVAKSDLYEREGKDQHAFCLQVGREHPYDVRVLANLRPDAYWMDTALHEFGHAAYDRNVNPKLPYLLRGTAHTCATEAIALMMGALATDPGWISSVAGERVDADADKLRRRRREEKLVFVRWVLVMYRFEQALYENPGRDDLNSLWWDLVERFQMVERPPGRDRPDWAAKIHLSLAPVYYHNYALGGLVAAQLRHYVEEHVSHGPLYDSEAAGRYLKEAFFGPGAREDWRTLVARSTGEPLDPAYFTATLRP